MTPPETVHFATLPFVSMTDDVQIGDFVLWRSTQTAWMTKAGVDFSWFFDMYRDAHGKVLHSPGSVLTHKSLGDFSDQQARDAVHALSTVAWLDRQRDADPWLFERWSLPFDSKSTDRLTIHAKFSVQFTSFDRHRVYATPYLTKATLNLYHLEKVLAFLNAELAKPRKDSIIDSLSYFHLARFETPYFTSVGDDLESMWSGFESFYHFPITTTIEATPATTPPSTVKIGREEYLLLRLHEDLNGLALSEDFWSKAKKWAEEAYRLRNEHAHGSGQTTQLKLHESEVSVYNAGLLLAENVLKRRAFASDPFMENSVRIALESTFTLAPTIRSIVAALKNIDRRDLYPPVQSAGQGKLVHYLAGLFSKMTESEKLPLQFGEDADLGKARRQLSLVLSAWSKDLAASPETAMENPLAGLATYMKSVLVNGNDDKEYYENVANYLVSGETHNPTAYYAVSKKGALVLHQKLPVWLVVDAYLRLHELYIGYAVH